MIARAARTNFPPPDRRSAFTITELLIVIAIIAMLIALVLVTMSGVRSAGSRADSLNSLRQMVAGYNSYTSENRQRLMPGFVHPDHIEDDVPLDARLQDGRRLYQDLDYPADVGPYVWRLAPYVGHDWQIFFTDYRSSGTVGTLVSEYENDVFGPGSHDDNLGIAMMPAFGLNSIFLGGDTTHGGPAVDYNPLTGTESRENWTATRLSQVRNPANVIVFGPAGRANPATDAEPYIFSGSLQHEMGYFELRPPFVDRDDDGEWTHQQWRARATRYGEIEQTSLTEFADDPYGAGLPIARWGANHYPVAHLDGSATTVDLEGVGLDMRRWSPFAVGTEIPAFDPVED